MLSWDPLKLMVRIPERFSKINMVFKTKSYISILQDKFSICGLLIVPVVQDFKDHMQRNSEAGELLREFLIALMQKWYFMPLLGSFDNLFCVLLIDSYSL